MMYGMLWRLLPGDRVVKALIVVILVVAVAAVLWYGVFPWVEPKIQFDHGTVEGGGTSAPATPRP
jgi:hypothetical protein